MEEIFVTKVRINKVRHLENLEIPLSDTERKHLILTGKNGSGKTSVLEGIVTFLNGILADSSSNHGSEVSLNEEIKDTFRAKELSQMNYEPGNWKVRGMAEQRYLNGIENIEKRVPVQLFSKEDLYKNNNWLKNQAKGGSYIIKYFKAKRDFQPKESLGPQKIELKNLYEIDENANENFVRQLVNLRFDLLDTKDLGKKDEVERIEKWFHRFENALKDILEDTSLELVFDRPNFNYNIITINHNPFNLNQLSGGYAAFLSIVSELMMRMDKRYFFAYPYNMPGLVLIDEIETHLHIDLQKKILPFLTTFFPKIQFIVTTHSPFVLSSIDNAVIYDLEKQIRVEDLSGYSVEGIIEGYFDNEKYSESIKKKINEYEKLMEKDILNDVEKDRLHFLDKYLDELPDFLSIELQVKIQQIKLAKLV